MKKSIVAGFACLMPFLMANQGCDEVEAQPTKITQAQKAAEAANSIQFSENAEIDNIKRRLELTSNPGAIGFIMLLNEAGQPIAYEGVKGKVTSSGKRLTTPDRVEWGYEKPVLRQSPADEGTWGHSDDYIYYWTMNDEYRQWNGKYLYSDKPFRTRVEPLVIAVQK